MEDGPAFSGQAGAVFKVGGNMPMGVYVYVTSLSIYVVWFVI